MEEFETYQPATIKPNDVTTPRVFNGLCLVRRYKVTIEEVAESDDVVGDRLQNLWANRRELRITHSSNMAAMRREAEKLGITLD